MVMYKSFTYFTWFIALKCYTKSTSVSPEIPFRILFRIFQASYSQFAKALQDKQEIQWNNRRRQRKRKSKRCSEDRKENNINKTDEHIQEERKMFHWCQGSEKSQITLEAWIPIGDNALGNCYHSVDITESLYYSKYDTSLTNMSPGWCVHRNHAPRT
jgi:hypothetical protein